MVIHFRLHSSWSQSLLLAAARHQGVTLGKDQHWHFNGITGLWVYHAQTLTIEIIERPCDWTRDMITRTIRMIQSRLLEDQKTNGQ